jgi:hypothetical protein
MSSTPTNDARLEVFLRGIRTVVRKIKCKKELVEEIRKILYESGDTTVFTCKTSKKLVKCIKDDAALRESLRQKHDRMLMEAEPQQASMYPVFQIFSGSPEAPEMVAFGNFEKACEALLNEHDLAVPTGNQVLSVRQFEAISKLLEESMLQKHCATLEEKAWRNLCVCYYVNRLRSFIENGERYKTL